MNASTGTRKRRGRKSRGPSSRKRQGAVATRSFERGRSDAVRIWIRLGIGGALVSTLLAALALFLWANQHGPGKGTKQTFVVEAGAPLAKVVEGLAAQRIVPEGSSFERYVRWVSAPPVPGQHVLRDNLSFRELAQRLGRLPGRPRVKVTLPEGLNHLQMADRLQAQEACSAVGFRSAVNDPTLSTKWGPEATSAEGRLFPATYELYVDSDEREVAQLLAAESQKRLGRLLSEHSASVARLKRELGWGEQQILTLASIVEKEAAGPEELPLIASVFFNRLTNPTFEPRGRLQSDPTAAYGCEVLPELAPSCAEFQGKVTPAILRDEKNPYNTYRHAGLPPGPIGNPGEKAILAVLEPAHTDYLFFFARGGRHTFTRTFEEHRSAIEGTLSTEGEQR